MKNRGDDVLVELREQGKSIMAGYEGESKRVEHKGKQKGMTKGIGEQKRSLQLPWENESPTYRLTVRMPEKLVRALKAYVGAEGRTIQSVLIELTSELMRKHPEYVELVSRE